MGVSKKALAGGGGQEFIGVFSFSCAAFLLVHI
jgi:hypothetical protein